MTENTPSVLITGGTGFLGRSLTRMLVEEGYSVRILSRAKYHPKHPNISFYQGDITKYNDLINAVQGCEAIFHCAAEKNNPEHMLDMNINSTRELFNIANKSKVKFFCHLSSVGVIGKTDKKIVNEFTDCNPMNYYEETKYAAEKIVQKGIDHGVVVILRPTNIFGPETMQSWLSKTWKSKILFCFKGRENAHLIYVEDVTSAAVFLFKKGIDRPVDTFIISNDEDSGNTFSEIREYLATINNLSFNSLGFSLPLFLPYLARLLKNKKSNLGDVVYSSRKLYEYGFKFPYGFKSGLKNAVNEIHNLKQQKD